MDWFDLELDLSLLVKVKSDGAPGYPKPGLILVFNSDICRNSTPL